jgi:hypothetical protein
LSELLTISFEDGGPDPGGPDYNDIVVYVRVLKV